MQTRHHTSRAAKRIVVVLCVAIGVYILGFGVLFVMMLPQEAENEPRKSGQPRVDRDDLPVMPMTGQRERLAQRNPELSDPGVTEEQDWTIPPGDIDPQVTSHETVDSSIERDAGLATRPPPGGVILARPFEPLRCWDRAGIERRSKACDRLVELEQRLLGRLYLFEECRKTRASEYRRGEFRAQVEVDFIRKSIAFLEDKTSALVGSDAVADCLTKAFARLSLDGLSRKNDRYHLALSVQFGAVTPGRESEEQASRGRSEALTELDEKIVNVVRDRVRVRKAPVDGEIIGFVSSPQRVILLEIKKDWCRVRTSRGNDGWVVCWGLDLK